MRKAATYTLLAWMLLLAGCKAAEEMRTRLQVEREKTLQEQREWQADQVLRSKWERNKDLIIAVLMTDGHSMCAAHKIWSQTAANLSGGSEVDRDAVRGTLAALQQLKNRVPPTQILELRKVGQRSSFECA